MIRRNRVLRHICRLFPVVDLKDISEDLAALNGFRDDDAGNALIVGLLRVKTEGVVIPRPLNKDLIFIEAVRSVRAAEPHQRFVFGIPAFGSAADDTLVDVEVFLVAVYMTVHAVSYTHLLHMGKVFQRDWHFCKADESSADQAL